MQTKKFLDQHSDHGQFACCHSANNMYFSIVNWVNPDHHLGDYILGMLSLSIYLTY